MVQEKRDSHLTVALRQANSLGILGLAIAVPLSVSGLFHDFNTLKHSIIQTVVPLLAILSLARWVSVGQIAPPNRNLGFAFFIIFVVCLGSLTQAVNVSQGLRVFWQYACNFLLLVVVTQEFRSDRQVNLLCNTMAAVGGTVALIGLLQQASIIFVYTRWNYPVSTLGNATLVAAYYNIIFPIVFSQGIRYLGRWWCLVFAAIALLMGVHSFYLGSRAGWLGLMLCVATFIIAWIVRARVGLRRRMVLAFYFAGILGVAAWFSLEDWEESPNLVRFGTWENVVYRVYEGVTFRDQASLQRLYLWKDSLRLILDNPLLGVGLGNFEYVIPTYSSEESLEIREWMERRNDSQYMPFSAHNEYLEIWAEIGILGCLGLGLLVWKFGGGALSRLQRLGEDNYYLAVGMATSICIGMLHALFSANLQAPASGCAFWMIVGMIGAVGYAKGNKPIGLRTTELTKVGLMTVGFILLLVTAFVPFNTLQGAYYFKKGLVIYERGESPEARESLKLATSYWPPMLFNVYQTYALTLYNEGRWEEAINVFHKSLLYHPNNDRVLFYIGHSHRQMGRYQESIMYLRKALLLNPISDNFRREYGMALGFSGDYKSAIEQLEHALLSRESPKTYHALGMNYKRIGELDKAVVNYKNALNSDPDNPDILNSLGVILLQQNKAGEAVVAFDRLTKRWPKNPDYFLNLGICHIVLGNANTASSYFRRVLQLSPKHKEAQLLLSQISRPH